MDGGAGFDSEERKFNEIFFLRVEEDESGDEKEYWNIGGEIVDISDRQIKRPRNIIENMKKIILRENRENLKSIEKFQEFIKEILMNLIRMNWENKKKLE